MKERADAVGPVDPGTIENLRVLGGGNDDLLDKIIGVFLSSSDLLVVDLRKAVVGGDHEAASAAAHSLKSASGNLGAFRLMELCGELEHAGADGDAQQELLPSLTAEFDLVRHALRSIASDIAEDGP